MRKLAVFVIPFLAVTVAHSQPLPCGPKPDMTSTCIEACVICDIDGYTGINDDPVRGQAPPGFCTGTVHHMQWIAFIAGSKDLTITVTPSGCKLGAGLEVGIYESLDCNTFKLVSNCNGGIAPGQTGVFNNIQPLVVGQYYYFVMDGNMNDVCNYTIRVTRGSAKVPPLPATGAIRGPAEVCQTDSVPFSVAAITGATFYEWRLDGKLVAEGLEAKIGFPDAGVHQLCVTAFNVCDTADASCMAVQVHEAKTTYLTEVLCEGACLEVADTVICAPGEYTFRLVTAQGCDSVVRVSVFRIATVSSALSATLCSTDSLLVGDSWYHPPGEYVETQPSSKGCDSLIYLTLRAIICEITGSARGQPVLCHGDSTGALAFLVQNGTPPFFYSWERLGGSPSGSGSLSGLNEEVRIGSLPAGTYLIAVRDTFGNDAVFQAQVTEPPPLSAGLEGSDFNGFAIACPGGSNGALRAIAQGGTPPYAYKWSTGSQQRDIGGLSAGRYSTTVTDLAGCSFSSQTELTAPPPLEWEALFADPTCDGFNTGSIAAQNVTGGVGPYLFSLSGGEFRENPVFSGLEEGSYTIRIKDANGCTDDTSATLVAAAIPTLILGGDYELRLGYSLQIQASVNLNPQTIRWAPSEGLSCSDCLEPVAAPVKTSVYTLEVTSADGCLKADSVLVKVLRLRKVFAPNAFSPNADGVNDWFTIYADAALEQIKQFRVFARWGDLVFERSDFPANDPTLGWDGRFRGQALENGVFLWWAELEYIDGASEIVKGEVAIVK